jgi:hypothetical protein
MLTIVLVGSEALVTLNWWYLKLWLVACNLLPTCSPILVDLIGFYLHHNPAYNYIMHASPTTMDYSIYPHKRVSQH